MPFSSEVSDEISWLAGFSPSPRKEEPVRRANVCQRCGEIALIPTARHRIAAYGDHGDFIAFWGEHRDCPAYRSLVTGWRYCEICRCQTDATKANRCGLSWICPDCRSAIRENDRGEAGLLEGLARLRGRTAPTRHGRFRAVPVNRPRSAEEVPLGAGIPGGWMPIGIRECPDCGIGTGSTFVDGGDGQVRERASRCRCEIPRCRTCGDRSLLGEPATSHYSVRRGTWIYTSVLVGSFTRYCRACLQRRGTISAPPPGREAADQADVAVKTARLLDRWKVEDELGPSGG